MKMIRVVAAGLCAVALTYADFSYEQTSKITGGVAASAAKVMSVFSKKTQEPTRTTILLKGNRMAYASAERVQVIDLASETITEIDLGKKTYSVMTFTEMTQAMQKIMEESSGKQDARADVKFRASVKETGQRKSIAGLDTREVILTLEMESTDKKSGDKGSFTTVSDMWVASTVPGYEEVKRFHERMGTKLAWTPGSRGLVQGNSEMAKGMTDLQKESAKLDGVPVLQVIRMGTAGQPQSAQAQQAQRQQAPEATPREESSSPSITGALGKLGGLGGFGRRKKKEEAPADEKVSQSSPPPAAGVLMEMTSESSSFSTAAVDASRFEVPAGFKKVENDLAKALRK